jgi:hypothetical protein
VVRGVGDFIARPTDLLLTFFQEAWGQDKSRISSEVQLGRLAMGLEVMTLIKTLEDRRVPVMTSREEIISVLTTFLVDQELWDVCEEWYEFLSDWRRPKFVPASGVSSSSGPVAPASVLQAQRDAGLQPRRTDDELSTRRSLGPSDGPAESAT